SDSTPAYGRSEPPGACARADRTAGRRARDRRIAATAGVGNRRDVGLPELAGSGWGWWLKRPFLGALDGTARPGAGTNRDPSTAFLTGDGRTEPRRARPKRGTERPRRAARSRRRARSAVHPSAAGAPPRGAGTAPRRPVRRGRSRGSSSGR